MICGNLVSHPWQSTTMILERTKRRTSVGCSHLCYFSFVISPISIMISFLLSTFYSTHRHGAQNPCDDDLLQCLKDLLEVPGQAPVYLIIDGLDECSNTSAIPSHRAEVLNLVEQLVES